MQVYKGSIISMWVKKTSENLIIHAIRVAVKCGGVGMMELGYAVYAIQIQLI